MLKKVLNYFRNIITLTFCFNPLIAIKLLIFPLFQKDMPAYERFENKHKTIKKYLKKRYKRFISEHKDKYNTVNSSFAEQYPIWFMWWHGEDQMPPIVDICYKTVKQFSRDHTVNLITKENFLDYVCIPDYIMDKSQKGKISLTHLSDVIRMCLLYQHGGLWLDSTVLLTQPLPPLPEISAHLGFWTPKDDGKILETCFGAKNWIVRENKWLTFCLYTSKGNILPEFVRSMFFAYFKKKSVMIDYFLFDYFISIAYDAFPQVRKMIDSVPDNNSKIHELFHRLELNSEYNSVLFGEICSNTFFHKLNWKEEYNEYTINKKLTNYGYITNHFPPK